MSHTWRFVNVKLVQEESAVLNITGLRKISEAFETSDIFVRNFFSAEVTPFRRFFRSRDAFPKGVTSWEGSTISQIIWAISLQTPAYRKQVSFAVKIKFRFFNKEHPINSNSFSIYAVSNSNHHLLFFDYNYFRAINKKEYRNFPLNRWFLYFYDL